MVPSWEHVVAATDHNNQLVSAVHGVLRHYDLPDLIDMVDRDRVVIEEPADPLGNSIAADPGAAVEQQ
jgi:hypothetical protein